MQGRKKRAERNVSGTLFCQAFIRVFFYDIKQLTPPLPPAPAIRKFVIEIERIHKHHVQAADPVFRRSVVMLAAAINLRARFYVGDQIILTSDGIRQLGVRFSDAVQPVRIASAKAGLIEFLRQPFRFCVRLRSTPFNTTKSWCALPLMAFFHSRYPS